MIRLKRNINDELVRAYVLAVCLVIFVQLIAFNSRVFLNFSREKWNSRVNRGILLVYFKVKISKFQSFINFQISMEGRIHSEMFNVFRR